MISMLNRPWLILDPNGIFSNEWILVIQYGWRWILTIEIFNMHHIHFLGLYEINISCHIELSHYWSYIDTSPMVFPSSTSTFIIMTRQQSMSSSCTCLPQKHLLTLRCGWLSPMSMIRLGLLIECCKTQKLRFLLMLLNGKRAKKWSEKSPIKLYTHQINHQ